jgi:hypothetical protein
VLTSETCAAGLVGKQPQLHAAGLCALGNAGPLRLLNGDIHAIIARVYRLGHACQQGIGACLSRSSSSPGTALSLTSAPQAAPRTALHSSWRGFLCVPGCLQACPQQATG